MRKVDGKGTNGKKRNYTPLYLQWSEPQHQARMLAGATSFYTFRISKK